MKKVFYLLFILAAIRTNAQDYPPSVGPAPIVDNYNTPSEVFTTLNTNSRQLTCIHSNTTSSNKYRGLLNTCSLVNIGPPLTYFAGAYARVTPNRHYILDQIGLRLIRTDTLGFETVLGAITGLPQANITGMTWDATTGTMFVITTSLTASRLGRLDTTTRVVTPIGDSSAVCAGAISVSCSPGGTLFVIDIVGDNLYRVDKTTGIFTLKGPVTPCNFGQDAHFDYDGVLYWAAYTTGPQLRVLDTTNGSSLLVCTYVGVQTTAISTIPWTTSFPIVNLCRNGLNVVIPDLGSARDSVFSFAETGSVLDVNVKIDTVVHTFDSDLIFYLRKGNIGVKIINRAGAGGDNFIGTVLDDEASFPLSFGSAPFTGLFRPDAPLTAFDGAFPGDYWKLHITDTIGGDSGVLKAWCVILNIIPVGTQSQTIEIPNSYRLYQNYPNPFNPTTKIKFGIPQAANVKLTVYDVLGREVAVLVNEFKQPNTYEVDFDGSNLPSGVYFYKLVADDFAATKKMLMVK